MAATAKTARRTASRAKRRQQLIDATMKCIARKGMGGTTLADVAREAGLSQGIVNLHFKSKENLLISICDELVNTYIDGIKEAADGAGTGWRGRQGPRLLGGCWLLSP